MRMPMMARMYAQRTEQSPREYFPVLAPHMSRIVSASQPSGKIMQPSTRHRAEGAPAEPTAGAGSKREGVDYFSEPEDHQKPPVGWDPAPPLRPSTQELVNLLPT